MAIILRCKHINFTTTQTMYGGIFVYKFLLVVQMGIIILIYYQILLIYFIYISIILVYRDKCKIKTERT
jgi:hypothetical protein